MIERAKTRRPAPTRSSLTAAAAVIILCALSACAAPSPSTSPPESAPAEAAPPESEVESIYVLRSIREQPAPSSEGCAASQTGFEPFPADAERFFSFWSVRTGAEDGKVIDAKQARVAELRGCFGPTEDRARQHFSAEIELGGMSFRGKGECLALAVDVPEAGLFPVRCQLVLSGLPAPFVGGLLTTNTITSQASFGGETNPPGYTQASMATIRLWKTRQRPL